MAIAARTLRATGNQATAGRAAAVRSRVHNSDGARVMVKRTASVAHLAPKPQLTLVPRRRRTARLIAAVSIPVFALMLGAASFQTQLASRQVRLDAVDREIREAYENYDTMRRERAELRSPGRLAVEAAAIGMVLASQTQFIGLDPTVIEAVQRAGTQGDGKSTSEVGEEFQQYADVKAQSGGSP